ncbi:hypothetical protein KCP74_21215 [Salmonella enterica subsp. enterica]|nr:hypothetical protein KCP74_21215 [Salmonella enterica subsp. enterica]
MLIPAGKRVDFYRDFGFPPAVFAADDGRRLLPARVSTASRGVRLAVKLDFITALLKNRLRMYGYRRSSGRRPDPANVARAICSGHWSDFYVFRSNPVGKRRLATGPRRAANLS